MDLGIHELTVKGGERSSSDPIELALTSQDGKPLNVASLRGKPVVVTFWANWALGAQEHLKRVDTVRSEFPGSDEFSFVAVNLDDGSNSKAVGIDSHWIQARAEGKDRLALVEKLGVSTLPLTLLLDASGQLVARDLPSDRLKSGLVRAGKSRPGK
jgi:hypothetical protein